jgi:hypothetical protein
MSTLTQPQQPSTSKLSASKLKEKLKKDKCLLRSSNNSPKPNLALDKCLYKNNNRLQLSLMRRRMGIL